MFGNPRSPYLPLLRQAGCDYGDLARAVRRHGVEAELRRLKDAGVWVSLDEFESGYDPNRIYGMGSDEMPASQVDLWGIIAGDKSWRKSAHALQELIAELPDVTAENREA